MYEPVDARQRKEKISCVKLTCRADDDKKIKRIQRKSGNFHDVNNDQVKEEVKEQEEEEGEGAGEVPSLHLLGSRVSRCSAAVFTSCVDATEVQHPRVLCAKS